MGVCCLTQETQTGALYQPRGVEWGGRWEGGSKGRGYMYTYGNVSFHVTLSIHLTLSSPLPMSISVFFMSVSPLLPCK